MYDLLNGIMVTAGAVTQTKITQIALSFYAIELSAVVINTSINDFGHSCTMIFVDCTCFIEA